MQAGSAHAGGRAWLSAKLDAACGCNASMTMEEVAGLLTLQCSMPSMGLAFMQVGIAMRAAGRLSAKLDAARGSGRPVDMEEEFRLLTLQVIGEAVLSLPPEECNRVRPRSI